MVEQFGDVRTFELGQLPDGLRFHTGGEIAAGRVERTFARLIAAGGEIGRAVALEGDGGFLEIAIFLADLGVEAPDAGVARDFTRFAPFADLGQQRGPWLVVTAFFVGRERLLELSEVLVELTETEVVALALHVGNIALEAAAHLALDPLGLIRRTAEEQPARRAAEEGEDDQKRDADHRQENPQTRRLAQRRRQRLDPAGVLQSKKQVAQHVHRSWGFYRPSVVKIRP